MKCQQNDRKKRSVRSLRWATMALAVAGLAQAATAAEVSVTLNTSTADDTYLHGFYPTLNSGTDNLMYVGKLETDFRGLIRIDDSAFPVIPGGNVVTSATLTLYAYTASSIASTTRIEMHRSLKPWTESGATWNTYDGSTAWSAAGMTDAGGDPDYSSTLIDDQEWLANDVPIVFDITSTYQAWDSGALDNNGIAMYITGDDIANSYVAFYTTDFGSSTPVLTVTYEPIPEPASLALIGLGSGLMLIRRKH